MLNINLPETNKTNSNYLLCSNNFWKDIQFFAQGCPHWKMSNSHTDTVYTLWTLQSLRWWLQQLNTAVLLQYCSNVSDASVPSTIETRNCVTNGLSSWMPHLINLKYLQTLTIHHFNSWTQYVCYVPVSSSAHTHKHSLRSQGHLKLWGQWPVISLLIHTLGHTHWRLISTDFT